MKRLEGRVVLVAGASRGIGKAIALACAGEGARVAVVAREGATPLPGSVGDTVGAIRAGGGTAEAFVCDVAESAAVLAMAADVENRLGAVDVLINSTATFVYSSVVDTTDEEWDRVFATNVRAAFLLTRAVLPSMLARRAGNIIHLTGAGARNVAFMPSVSGASKAALERFTLGVAHEVRDRNVAVNLFDPGGVKTERALALRGPAFDWTGFAAPSEVAPGAVHLATRTAAEMSGRIFSHADYARGER